MDGKGRATNNIWIERFWKTIKYNQIHLNPSDTGLELFEGVQTYIEYYHQKNHQSIGMKPITWEYYIVPPQKSEFVFVPQNQDKHFSLLSLSSCISNV
jgi:putative transposase